LEKLYVPVRLRKGGIASGILVCAEEYCRQRQVPVLRLWANPLDDDTDQDWLIGWYGGVVTSMLTTVMQNCRRSCNHSGI
jgi:hypothetical protein